MNNDIKFSKYKCFHEETLITDLNLFNVFIGRNNCGKTSVLEIIEKVFSKEKYESNNLIQTSVISIKSAISQNAIRSCFFQNQYSTYEFDHFGQHLSDFEIANSQLFQKKMWFNYQNAEAIDPQYKCLRPTNLFDGISWNKLNQCIITNLDKYLVNKISAERDIKSEKRDISFIIDSHGNGFTSTLNFQIHNVKGNPKVKEYILATLNKIMQNDDSFSDIDILDSDNDVSIYLYNGDNRIPLSQMGSGLKTILMVIAILFLGYEKDKKSMFIFEELENNLHPEIQRRLFNFIYDFSKEHNTPVFLSTHSHVAINIFYGKEKVSLYHISKIGGVSRIENIKDNLKKAIVLDDLGVLASDIFQSNGIVWVEGPSDRIYIKSWLKLIAPELEENVHYTFMYYGGKLIAHYTCLDDQTAQNEMINVLLTNRNSAIIMDSDIKANGGELNKTKKRIIEEFGEERFVWVTCGREIENYISKNALNRLFECDKFRQINKFKDFKDYIKKYDSSFENHKVDLAKSLTFKIEDLNVMDLKDKVIELANTIRKWN